MTLSAALTTVEAIAGFRDQHRIEMDCQIVHDSIHDRHGWTDEYLLFDEAKAVGYGSVAVGGPWKESPVLYQFYVEPEQRRRAFDLFRALLDVCRAPHLLVQSNDTLATAMLENFCESIDTEAILFHDQERTSLQPPGASFRAPLAGELPDISADQLRWHGVVEVEGAIAATGGILFHYNRPYGDIYMETRDAFRRRGLGSFLVQELKRVCYEGGHVPAARCGADNKVSRRTLQRAGFTPCGHLLKGVVR